MLGRETAGLLKLKTIDLWWVIPFHHGELYALVGKAAAVPFWDIDCRGEAGRPCEAKSGP